MRGPRAGCQTSSASYAGQHLSCGRGQRSLEFLDFPGGQVAVKFHSSSIAISPDHGNLAPVRCGCAQRLICAGSGMPTATHNACGMVFLAPVIFSLPQAWNRMIFQPSSLVDGLQAALKLGVPGAHDLGSPALRPTPSIAATQTQGAMLWRRVNLPCAEGVIRRAGAWCGCPSSCWRTSYAHA